MRIGRTILTLLIAISVALLPAAGGAAVAVKSSDMAAMTAARAMPASGDMAECCPHQTNPCGKAADNCASMAACALKWFNFCGTDFSALIFPPVGSALKPLLMSQNVPTQSGAPPFRPPRV
jgi:hypothetical protein